MEPSNSATMPKPAEVRTEPKIEEAAISWNEKALQEQALQVSDQMKIDDAQTPCQTLADDEEEEDDIPVIKNNCAFNINSNGGGDMSSQNFMNLLSSKLQEQAEEDCNDSDEEMTEEEVKRREDFESKMKSQFKGGSVNN